MRTPRLSVTGVRSSRPFSRGLQHAVCRHLYHIPVSVPRDVLTCACVSAWLPLYAVQMSVCHSIRLKRYSFPNPLIYVISSFSHNRLYPLTSGCPQELA